MFEDTDEWDEFERDNFEDDDFGDEDYAVADDDEAETVECPECGCDVYEDAEQCPACGSYIVHSHAYLWKNRPLWWIVLGAIGIAAVIVVFLF